METLGGKFLLERLAILEDLCLGGVVLINRHDDHVLRGEAGRSDEAVVIGMRHDHAADEAGRDAPRSGVRILLRGVLVLETDIAGLSEVLTEVVRRSSLEGLTVLHHGLNTEGVDGTREALAFGLAALNHGHRHVVFREVSIDLEHLVSLFHGFGFRRVNGVAFLPEELGGTEEEARAHFPADNVSPLVDENRKVAIRLYPLRVSLANDGLGGRTDNERLLELARGDEFSVRAHLEARVGDDGTFLGEAVDVRGFLLDIADRNEEREVGVHVAGLLEHRVEVALDVLPQGVTPRLDNHAAADGAVLRQVGVLDDLKVPLRVVFGAGRRDGGLGLGGRLLGHGWSKEGRNAEGQDGFLFRGRVSTAC